MEELRRYKVFPVGLGEIDIDRDDNDGQYVEYEQAIQLIAERDALQAQVAKLEPEKAELEGNKDKAFVELREVAIKALKFVCTACVELEKNNCSNCALKETDIAIIEKYAGQSWEEINK